jgi:hypothetical protein
MHVAEVALRSEPDVAESVRVRDAEKEPLRLRERGAASNPALLGSSPRSRSRANILASRPNASSVAASGTVANGSSLSTTGSPSGPTARYVRRHPFKASTDSTV